MIAFKLKLETVKNRRIYSIAGGSNKILCHIAINSYPSQSLDNMPEFKIEKNLDANFAEVRDFKGNIIGAFQERRGMLYAIDAKQISWEWK